MSNRVAIAASAVGILASVALLWEQHHAGSLCDPQSGCSFVQAWAEAHLPFSLATAGIAAFALILLVACLRRRWLGPLTLVAGVAGLALLLVQAFVIHHFCRLCLVADASALVLAGSRFLPQRLTVAASVAAAGLAAIFLHGRPPVPIVGPAPAPVEIVEVGDPTCEVCCAQRDRLERIVVGYDPSCIELRRESLPAVHRHLLGTGGLTLPVVRIGSLTLEGVQDDDHLAGAIETAVRRSRS